MSVMGQTEKLLGLSITAFPMHSSPDELAVAFAFLLHEGFVIRLASKSARWPYLKFEFDSAKWSEGRRIPKCIL